jgi:hypothetical protein
VSFLGTAAHVTMGWGGDPALRSTVGGKSALFGTLLHVTPAGTYKVVADIAAHEGSFNPSGGNPDSNPYNALPLPGRRIVADAGANALVEALAIRHPDLAVPPLRRWRLARRLATGTDLRGGRPGRRAVGQLTSFPFWAGTSSVLRISSDGGSITTFATGFTAIVDVAFDTGGALYVLEIATGQSPPFPPPNPGLGNGRLLAVSRGRTTVP